MYLGIHPIDSNVIWKLGSKIPGWTIVTVDKLTASCDKAVSFTRLANGSHLSTDNTSTK